MNREVTFQVGRHELTSSPLMLIATVAVLAFAFMSLAETSAPAHAADAVTSKRKSPKKTKPRLQIVSSTQLSIQRTGKVIVRGWNPVPKKADRKAKKAARRTRQTVRLSLSVKQKWSAAVKVRPIRVKLTPYRTKTVKIKLNPAALALVKNCGAPALKLTARGYRGRKFGTWSKTTSKKLKRNTATCAVPADVDLSKADACDFITAPGNACMAPYPSDFYTRPDSSTPTGLRLDVDPGATPVNKYDKNIEVTDLNTSDGFSPGPLISIRIPGMDNQAAFDNSGIVPITRMSKSFEAAPNVVLIDADTGQRQLIWAELDSNATSDAARNLIIRPGKNLADGHRYIVALRGMKQADGSDIEAPAGFRLYRDGTRTDNQIVESRREHFESIFDSLEDAGISQKGLYLAWDFTVASTKNITDRMLSIRNRGFAELGDTDLLDGQVQGTAPDYTITSVINYPTAVGNGVENIRTVTGTFQVPCYLNTVGCPPGSVFKLDANEQPIRIPGNEVTARFTCNIPRSAVIDDGMGGFEVDHKVRPSLYGHGLFGQYTETNTGNVRQLGNENGVMTCGTDFIGMAQNDVVLAAVPALQDLSKFSALPDRLQQGFLDFLYLGRLMIHDDGFAADPDFAFGGESVIDTSDLFYYGNSQGGIAGGALTAVATDFTRSVLYVPGINYSTLLTRSVDFDTYKLLLYPSYPDEVSRPVLFSIMQSLWDRGEPNGYASHMTDNPLPGTPPHKVMLEMAYGDHQVANVATEVEARTIGAPLRMPALDSNRQPTSMIEPFYGHETLGDLAGPAADGNAYFIWDIGPKREISGTEFGTLPPPITNTPPPEGSGVDPHDTVINNSPLIRKQIADFLTTNGKVTNPCGLNPCYAAGWNGFP